MAGFSIGFQRLLLLLLVSASLAVLSCQNQDGPCLSETLKWMDQTYNPHPGGASLGMGHGRLSESRTTPEQTLETLTRTEARFVTRDCKMTLETEWFMPDHESTESTRKFDLGQIDPQTIRVIGYNSTHAGTPCEQLQRPSCDTAEVVFSTTNDAISIDEKSHTVYLKLTGGDREQSNQGKTNHASLPVDGLQYAQRLANSFRHAVVLCGGRVSAF